MPQKTYKWWASCWYIGQWLYTYSDYWSISLHVVYSCKQNHGLRLHSLISPSYQEPLTGVTRDSTCDCLHVNQVLYPWNHLSLSSVVSDTVPALANAKLPCSETAAFCSSQAPACAIGDQNVEATKTCPLCRLTMALAERGLRGSEHCCPFKSLLRPWQSKPAEVGAAAFWSLQRKMG